MKYKLIVNPIAGRGKTKKMYPQLMKILKEAGVDFHTYITRGHGDAITAAREAAEEGFDVIVAVGGDGTVNEVANGIVGSTAVLATLPTGTGNDFATAVGMPADMEKSCAILLEGTTRKIDLGRVLDRYFVNAVGVGFDAAVAHRANMGVRMLRGVWVYIFSVFSTLISYQPVEMEIILDGKTLEKTPTLVAVGIGQCYGGGMRIVPDAIQDDGYFDVCVLDTMGRLEIAWEFPKVFKGTHKNIRKCDMFRAQEVELILADPRPLHMEGEVFFSDHMHFTLKKEGITVLSGPPYRRD